MGFEWDLNGISWDLNAPTPEYLIFGATFLYILETQNVKQTNLIMAFTMKIVGGYI